MSHGERKWMGPALGLVGILAMAAAVGALLGRDTAESVSTPEGLAPLVAPASAAGDDDADPLAGGPDGTALTGDRDRAAADLEAPDGTVSAVLVVEPTGEPSPAAPTTATTAPTSTVSTPTTSGSTSSASTSTTGASTSASPTTGSTTVPSTASTRPTSAPTTVATTARPTTSTRPPTVSTTTRPPTTAAPTTAAPSGDRDLERRVIELTNQHRAQNGCPPLTHDDRLHAAALGHSVDMATQNYFSHTSLDGSSMRDRIDRQGYAWRSIAENIAAGYPTPEAVVDGWMNSPGHRANILNCGLTEIGVGHHQRYWTQNFGAPR